jgi:uncharacterized membrane protein YedE/YeeE
MNSPGPSKQENTAAGFAVAVVLTMTIGAVISMSGYAQLEPFFGPTPTHVPCRQAYGNEGLLLFIALLAAALAWYMFFRSKARGFVAGLLRGAAIGMLIVVLVPWPCSYPSAAYDQVVSCTH